MSSELGRGANGSAFKIKVFDILSIKYQGHFRFFQFASAIHRKKKLSDSAETFLYYVGSGFIIPWHFAITDIIHEGCISTFLLALFKLVLIVT